MELWKTIPEYPNYQVSNLGRCRNIKYGRILVPADDKDGYKRLICSGNKKKKNYSVHKLVLTLFKGEAPEGMEVNHKNGKKYDNRLVNLEWVTHKENMKHMRKKRLGKKLSKQQVEEIKQEFMAMRPESFQWGDKTRALDELANRYKVSAVTITMVITGRYFKYVK